MIADRVVRVLLVEPAAETGAAIAGALNGHGIEVVAATGRGIEARRLLDEHGPDVAVVADDLPDADGNQLCREIREGHPNVSVVITSPSRREAALLAAFTAGARGFLLHGVDPVTLREAVRAVADGGTVVDPRVAGKLVGLAMRGRRTPGPFGLTPQQLRVLERLPRGLTYREIGEELGLARETVRSHVRQITRKLGAPDRARAAAIAIRHGIVER